PSSTFLVECQAVRFHCSDCERDSNRLLVPTRKCRCCSRSDQLVTGGTGCRQCESAVECAWIHGFPGGARVLGGCGGQETVARSPGGCTIYSANPASLR